MNRRYQTIVDMERTSLIFLAPAGKVFLGELVTIELDNGEKRLGRITRLQGERTFVEVFAGTRGISTDDYITPTGRPLEGTFHAENLLGRITDPFGEPLDGRPPVTRGEDILLGGPSINPAARSLPSEMIHTQIPAIDLFNTLVTGQKIPLFTVPGEPSNQVMARIATQAQADVIVVGLIGVRFDEFTYFREYFENAGAMEKLRFIVNTASDPLAARLAVPDRVLAEAEQWAFRGKNVLVLLTDMTMFAEALKVLNVEQGNIPSRAGYPGSLYSDLARRYEVAADLSRACGGAITLVGCTTMPGGDVTSPVPDNTGYITEGQYYLLFGKIDLAGSLSRLKQLVQGKKTRRDHSDLMNTLVRLRAEAQDRLESFGKKTEDDYRYFDFAAEFDQRLMDLDVSLPIDEALDTGWDVLAKFFKKDEIRIPADLADEFGKW
ncbi:V-type ATP synthase subunit B [Candidatus Hydrogenedentota bacterium]